MQGIQECTPSLRPPPNYSIFPPGAAKPRPVLLGWPPLLMRRVWPYTNASTSDAIVRMPPMMAHVDVKKWASDWRVSRWMTWSGEIS